MQIDWQMVAFVSVSVLHDYWVNHHLPKIYYWEPEKERIDGGHHAA